MGAAQGNGAGHQVRRTGTLFVRGTRGSVLETRELKVLRRVFGEAISGIAEKGILPDVDPRTPTAAGEKGTEGAWMGEGDRTSQAGKAGQAALRLCNLVAQSPSHAK